MNRKTFLLAAAAAMMPAPAMALDFSFSFSSDTSDSQIGNEVAGTVYGRILGLSDNSTGAAAQVFIDSYSAPGFSAVPTDAAAWSTIFSNVFTVANGAIIGAEFHSDRTASGSYDQLWINVPLGYSNGNTNYASTGVNNAFSIWNNNGANGVTFTALNAAVPEPSTWAMLILGFGMVGGALRSARRQRTGVAYA